MASMRVTNALSLEELNCLLVVPSALLRLAVCILTGSLSGAQPDDADPRAIQSLDQGPLHSPSLCPHDRCF